MQIRPARIGVPQSHREPRWTEDQSMFDYSCSRLAYIHLSHIRRFQGLASYYRRFIWNFARIAHPLYTSTDKCLQEGFPRVEEKLTTVPVLAYPYFNHDFVLETDTSVQGIEAVLGQYQKDDKLYPCDGARP